MILNEVLKDSLGERNMLTDKLQVLNNGGGIVRTQLRGKGQGYIDWE